MTSAPNDLTTTLFVLPPDAKMLSVDELAPRLRAKIGPANSSDVVVTRPGFRVSTRLVTVALAKLLTEFRSPCLLTDAIVRFSRSRRQDAAEILDLSFDALAKFIDGRILVAADSADAVAAAPSLAAGKAVGDMEILHLVRALDDTEVYRVRMADGGEAALKIARDDRAADMLAHEARILTRLGGGDTPGLLAQGRFEGRIWLAMEWRSGVPVAVAAQQLRAGGERVRLHRLVVRLLEGYARLHEMGIVHGDIHPSNILVHGNEVITILDFGRARLVSDSDEFDASRAGIAHFHDPQMATALLAGMVPPAASAVAEQYALAVLAYLVLTGLYPFEPAADHRELLTRIVTRPPLPFPARGVEAWPRVESVLRRALAKEETARFSGTAEFAQAFRNTGVPRPRPVRSDPCVERAIGVLRKGESLPGCMPTDLAWISLRTALARSDVELLAVASYWASRGGNGLAAASIAAHVALARSDQAELRDASQAFIAAARRVRRQESRGRALMEAAAILGNGMAFDLEPMKEWARINFAQLWTGGARGAHVIQAALALMHAGTIEPPSGIYQELEKLNMGSVWLWGQAYDVWQQAEHLDRACATPLPGNPLPRGLAYLRLHQLTGELRWVGAARRTATRQLRSSPDFGSVQLAIELEMPARAVPMPYR